MLLDLDAVPVTARDGCQHLVRDYALVEWCEVGIYPARCGAWVTAASMTKPARKRCYLCAPESAM